MNEYRSNPWWWAWLGFGAAFASALGYSIQRAVHFVSKPPLVGEVECYGALATSAALALFLAAIAARPARGHRAASKWGWIAGATTVLSLIGYILQTIFDHLTVPWFVAEVDFYAFFTGLAVGALIAGVFSIVVGRGRDDLTVSLGFIALGYVLAAQLLQSLWD